MPFVLQKLGRALLTLWAVVTFVFFALRISGDPVLAILPPSAPLETIEFYRRAWGLDRSLWQQYLLYLANILEGNLGRSFLEGRDAVDVVFERIPKTLALMLPALFLTLVIGIPAGAIAALNHNTPIDRAVIVAAVFGYSVPNFFLGVLLIFLFSVVFRVLPTSGSDTIWHYIMPVATIALSWVGIYARFVRSTVLEVLQQHYIEGATAKGLPWARVVRLHALPNAAIPVVTVAGFMVGGLIGGAIVSETVFAWPGVGQLLVNSVNTRDLAVVQVIVLLIASTMIASNLLVDLLYGWLDPRVRLTAARSSVIEA
ncbi:MAG: ABC transporter permease [Kiloniellales bacterium]|nr:ABC transporter permease [Kiloniellales bacterium]